MSDPSAAARQPPPPTPPTTTPLGKQSHRCANCDVAGKANKRCGRCLAVRYCSVACQRQHWCQNSGANHKAHCKPPPAPVFALTPPPKPVFAVMMCELHSAPALQQLVQMLCAYEPHLMDMLFDLVCMPQYLAWCAAELPADPAGVLGTFTVTIPASLSKISLPQNLTEIRLDAFRNCTSLGKVTLPPNLTRIGRFAFDRCTSLGEIKLPPNLTNIGAYAFYGCTSMTEV